MPIGISSFATYIPDRVQTSAYLAAATGIPDAVIEEKFGIVEKPWASDGEQVSAMAVKAACRALAGRDPRSIDVILWTGSEHKDFALWTAAGEASPMHSPCNPAAAARSGPPSNFAITGDPAREMGLFSGTAW